MTSQERVHPFWGETITRWRDERLTGDAATVLKLLGSDHSVPPTVSWRTYQFIIQMTEKYDRYE